MSNKVISRRKFLETTAAAAAVSVLPFNYSFATGSKKPNSKVNGVQLGLTTYSYRTISHNLDEVLEYVLKAGVNALEMRSVLEEGLGIPAGPGRVPRGEGLTDKEKAERAKPLKLQEKSNANGACRCPCKNTPIYAKSTTMQGLIYTLQSLLLQAGRMRRLTMPIMQPKRWGPTG